MAALSESDLRQLLTNHGRSTTGGQDELVRSADELLDQVSLTASLVPAVDLTNLDPRKSGEAEIDFQTKFGPCQQAFKNVSFTFEQKQLMIQQGGMEQCFGFDPELDARLTLTKWFAAADEGAHAHILEVYDFGGDPKTAVEGLLLCVDRVLDLSGTIVLQASFCHSKIDEYSDAVMRKLVMPRIQKQAYTKSRIDSRVLALVLQLANSNRQLLDKTFVNRSEKALNNSRVQPWRVTVFTPLLAKHARLCQGFAKAELSTIGEARRARKTLTDQLCCTMCGYVETESKLSSCASCLSAFYCSRECQKADWKAGHKQACALYAPATPRRPPSTLESALGELRGGDHVIIAGLQSAVALNGQRGTLSAFQEDTARWQVELPSGTTKLVKSANLTQDLDVAGPMNRLLGTSSEEVVYEEPERWAISACCVVPIEDREGRAPMAGMPIVDTDSMQPVEWNTASTRNLHGFKVFVVKAQSTEQPLFGKEHLMIYDQLRHVKLLLGKDEAGERKMGYDTLTQLAKARGGLVKGAMKVYLYAQRHGMHLRVFLARLPSQSQPF